MKSANGAENLRALFTFAPLRETKKLEQTIQPDF